MRPKDLLLGEPVVTKRQNPYPGAVEIHRDERSRIKVPAVDSKSGDDCVPDRDRHHISSPDLDDAGGRRARRRQNCAEIQIACHEHRVVVHRPGEEIGIRSIEGSDGRR